MRQFFKIDSFVMTKKIDAQNSMIIEQASEIEFKSNQSSKFIDSKKSIAATIFFLHHFLINNFFASSSHFCVSPFLAKILNTRANM